MELKEGQKAPEFSLPNQDGKSVSLSDYRGKQVLVYFYPKDDTPGCTKEACSMRDNMASFDDMGLVILGISTDSIESHRKFADKYGLNFNILSDTEKKTVEAYGVWQKKKMMGREYMGTVRSSFLIDEQGNILKMYQTVKPEEHASDVMEDSKRIKV